MISEILLAIALASAAFGIFLLLRNDWVYKSRVDLIYRDFESYKTLPSYKTMLWSFWVWDVAKFIGGRP